MLTALVTAALALNLAALAAFTALLAARAGERLTGEARRRRRQRLRSAFLSAVQGAPPHAEAGRLIRRRPIEAAELLLAMTDQIRGETLDRLTAWLHAEGLDRLLTRRLQRGADGDRSACAEALAVLGDAALPGVVAAYRTAHGGGRRSLALLLAGREDGPTVPQILADFGGPAGSPALLRSTLARVARLAGPQGVLAALADVTLDGGSRAACLEALTDTLTAAMLPELVRELGHAQPEVRAAAAALLGRLGHAAADPPLRLALADRIAEVRAAAARALGQVGRGASVDAVSHSLDDAVWCVRAAAAEALLRMGPEGRARLDARAQGSAPAAQAARIALAGLRAA